LLTAIALLCTETAHPQEAPPNLSGVWRLNKEKSHASGTTTTIWVKIEPASSSEITVTIRSPELITEKLHVPSDDNLNQIHGVPMKSSAKWKGATLAVDSVAVFDGTELRMNDTWVLSSDGQVLTYNERHQFGSEPQGLTTWVLERQPNASWGLATKPSLTEQEFKNIRVLTGMAATQLMPEMMGFRKALGVDCTHCHVQNEFEKDDKPAKTTARRMIEMVRQINADNFEGANSVSCWTCHRGRVKPEAEPK
jgi:hypothetical protein